MSVAFDQARVLAQVFRLREMAQEALRLYPLRVEDWPIREHLKGLV